MANNNFQFSFTSTQKAANIYSLLLDVKNWWSGLYDEIIEGESKKINDEFSFSAGNGAHYSIQKLLELVPEKSIKWIIIKSNLSFLTKKNEWDNTIICFEIEQLKDTTKVTFMHEGLVPQIECYAGCSSAWIQYIENLKVKLNS